MKQEINNIVDNSVGWEKGTFNTEIKKKYIPKRYHKKKRLQKKYVKKYGFVTYYDPRPKGSFKVWESY